MITLSPGLAQGCFELLEIVSRNALTLPQVQSSFAYLGSLPTSKVIETAQGLRWLRTDDKGIAILTPWGTRLLSDTKYESMLRQALLDYIDVESPPWIQNAVYGRSRLLSFASSEIAQVFIEADLAYGVGEQVVTFWDALAARARGQKNSRLTEIGREGERLTIAFEESRTGYEPKWTAIDNNEDGYDVLSIVSNGDARKLSIEVKASTMGMAGHFHLTRNEWERSEEADNHLFHVWAIDPKAKSTLAIVSPPEMKAHIPLDNGNGVWESVDVPFSAFKEKFKTY